MQRQPDQSYPVWSPYDAFEAADTMLKVLQAEKDQNRGTKIALTRSLEAETD